MVPGLRQLCLLRRAPSRMSTVVPVTDIVSWLREQLDADEQTARAAANRTGSERWVAEPYSDNVAAVLGDDSSAAPFVGGYYGAISPEAAGHIAVHDPALVLRTIAAYRAALVRHAADSGGCCDVCSWSTNEGFDRLSQPAPCEL